MLLPSTTNLNTALGLGPAEDGDDTHDLTRVRKNGSLYHRIQVGLFGVMSLLSTTPDKSSWSKIYLVNLIHLFQLLAFTFSTTSKFPWSDWVERTFTPIVKGSNLSIFTHISPDVATVSLCVCLGTLLLTLASVFWVGYSFANESVNQLWLLKPLRFALRLLTTVFYVPVLSVLIMVFRCDGTVIIFTCDDVMHTMMKLVVGAVMVVFVCFTCITVLVLVDRHPTSLNPLSQVHGRVDCLSLVLKFVLSVLMLMFSDSPKLSAGVIFVIAAALTWSAWFFLPHYSMEVNKVVLATYAVFLWSSICLLLEIFLQHESDDKFGSFLAFVAGAPFTALAAGALVDGRIQSLREKLIGSIDTPMLMELVLRVKYPIDSFEWGDVSEIYRTQADQTFKSSGFFLIHVSTLLDEWGGNHLLAGQYVRKCKTCDLRLDESFAVFKYNLEEEKRNVGVEGNAMNFMAFDHHSGEAQRRIIEAMDQIAKIWNALRSHECSQSELVDYGIKLRKSSKKASFHLEELMRLTNGSAAALRLYATFQENVLNDRETARIITQKADELEKEQRNNKGSKSGNMMTQAVVTIHGNEEQLGVIMDLTGETMSLFGYKKEELVGRNISELCPPPFDAMHNKFLRRYLETHTEFTTVTRPVWGLHNDGYALPLTLTVTPMIDSDGDLVFSGAFKSNEDFGDHFIVVDTVDLTIKFASKRGWENILHTDVPSRENINNHVHLSKFFSSDVLESPAMAELLAGSGGSTVDLICQGDEYAVKSTAHSFTVNVRGSQAQIDFVLLNFLCDDDDFEMMANPRTDDHGDAVLAITSHGNGTSSMASMSFGPNRRKTAITSGDAMDEEVLSDAGSESSSCGMSTASSRKSRSVFKTVEVGLMQNEKRLAKYKRLCILSMILCLLVAVLDWVLQADKSRSDKESIEQIYEGTLRAFFMIRGAMEVAILEWGFVHGKNISHPYMAEIFSELGHTVQGLDEVHRIISDSKASDFGRIEEITVTRDITFIVDQDDRESNRKVNLWVAVHEYLGGIKSLMQRPEDLNGCSDHCRIVLNNGPFSLAQVGNEASHEFAEGALEIMREVMILDTIFLFSSASFAVIVITFLIVPAVIENWRTQQRTAQALFSIPSHTIRIISRAANHRLISVKNALLDDSDDEAPPAQPQMALARSRTARGSNVDDSSRLIKPVTQGADDAEMSDVAGTKTESEERKPAVNVAKGASPVKKKKVANGWGSKVAPAGEGSKSKEKKKKQKTSFLQTSWWLCTAMGHSTFLLGLPFVVTVAYFALNVLIELLTSNERHDLAVAVDVASARWVQTELLGFLVIAGFGPTDSWNLWHNRTSEFVNFADNAYLDLRESHFSLLYGNETKGTFPIQDDSTHPAQYEILFEDGCSDNEKCALHADLELVKALHNGLAVGMKFFLESTKEKLDAAREALAANEVIGDDRAFLDLMNDFHGGLVLSENLKTSLNIYKNDAVQAIDLQLSLRRLLLVLYFLLLAWSGWLTFRLFVRMDERVQNIQILLLLVPASCLRSVPALRSLFMH